MSAVANSRANNVSNNHKSATGPKQPNTSGGISEHHSSPNSFKASVPADGAPSTLVSFGSSPKAVKGRRGDISDTTKRDIHALIGKFDSFIQERESSGGKRQPFRSSPASGRQIKTGGHGDVQGGVKYVTHPLVVNARAALMSPEGRQKKPEIAKEDERRGSKLEEILFRRRQGLKDPSTSPGGGVMGNEKQRGGDGSGQVDRRSPNASSDRQGSTSNDRMHQLEIPPYKPKTESRPVPSNDHSHLLVGSSGKTSAARQFVPPPIPNYRPKTDSDARIPPTTSDVGSPSLNRINADDKGLGNGRSSIDPRPESPAIKNSATNKGGPQRSVAASSAVHRTPEDAIATNDPTENGRAKFPRPEATSSSSASSPKPTTPKTTTSASKSVEKTSPTSATSAPFPSASKIGSSPLSNGSTAAASSSPGGTRSEKKILGSSSSPRNSSTAVGRPSSGGKRSDREGAAREMTIQNDTSSRPSRPGSSNRKQQQMASKPPRLPTSPLSKSTAPDMGPQAKPKEKNHETVDPAKLPLQNKWTLYYDSRNGAKSTYGNKDKYESNLQAICTVDNVADFCGLCNNVPKPSEMEVNSNFHMFKNGIKPMWEDPANGQGGSWTVSFGRTTSSEVVDQNWLRLLCATIGETLDPDDDVCGVIFNRRARGDRMAIWMRDGRRDETIAEIRKRLEKLLDLVGERVNIEFSLHENYMGSGTLYHGK